MPRVKKMYRFLSDAIYQNIVHLLDKHYSAYKHLFRIKIYIKYQRKVQKVFTSKSLLYDQMFSRLTSLPYLQKETRAQTM